MNSFIFQGDIFSEIRLDFFFILYYGYTSDEKKF
jgi:hypothetical protein